MCPELSEGKRRREERLCIGIFWCRAAQRGFWALLPQILALSRGDLLQLPSAKARFPQALFQVEEEMKPSGVWGRSGGPMVPAERLLFLCVLWDFFHFGLHCSRKGLLSKSRSPEAVFSGSEETALCGG